MTPAARIQTAIEILDRVIAGTSAEQALTQWARTSRYAGSGDRAAVRDHVFDALRCLRSFAALAGADRPGGRSCMIGRIVAAGEDPRQFFNGAPFAPAPLDAGEIAALERAQSSAAPDPRVALDCPDWLEAPLRKALGPDFATSLTAMRQRAPVFLRVNLAKAGRAEAQASLAADGIGTRPHPIVETALEVTENARRVAQSRAYLTGLVELQDAAPQAAVSALPLLEGMRVLDYCAGGGGKTLAMAARTPAHFVAHDAAPERMRNLASRTARAGVAVTEARTTDLARLGPFDLVLTDVPCSGTGTWRRAPEAKWRLTPERLDTLRKAQRDILQAAKDHVAPQGLLAYMTCALLVEENRDQVDRFLSETPGWRLISDRLWLPGDDGDGFYSALLTRE
ncbi:MAG: RsmB/NOP family class I SAM-dependent RNA methyltransferase [Rhodobacteraceae bacterium]|nr:RsmB/NOP family class I SAM-dependent RNA methyltransferase [Paracoccaceae bacterium]